MKTLLSFAILIVLMIRAQAGILANGDFHDGTAHWYGDGKALTDSDDLRYNPTAARGLVIQLNPERWTKISQTFNSKESSLALKLTYSLSADSSFAPGTQGLSVAQLFDMTGNRFKHAVNLKQDRWLILVNDPADQVLHYDKIAPKPGTTDPQTATALLPSLAAHEEKTLFLAFPPGHGVITLLNISLEPTNPAGAPATP